MNEPTIAIKHAVDTASGMAIAASLMGWLSPLAAALGAVWYVVQIFGWFEKRFSKKRAFKRRATDR